MNASTNVFVAGPLPPGPLPMDAVAGSVSRLSVTPPTVIVTDALPVTLPADGDVNVTWQRPLTVPVVEHVLVMICTEAPLELVSVTVGLTPSGTLTKPLPLPVLRFTVTVNVCGWPTSFV